MAAAGSSSWSAPGTRPSTSSRAASTPRWTTRCRTRPSGRSHISPKLRNQLRLLYALAVVLLGVVAARTARGEVPWWWPLPALAAGFALGHVVARVNVLHREEETGTIVGRTDACGAVILALYLAFSVAKGRLIGAWVHQARQAAVLGLALSAGVMLGRIRATIGGIRSLRLAADLDRGGRRASAVPAEQPNRAARHAGHPASAGPGVG